MLPVAEKCTKISSGDSLMMWLLIAERLKFADWSTFKTGASSDGVSEKSPITITVLFEDAPVAGMKKNSVLTVPNWFRFTVEPIVDELQVDVVIAEVVDCDLLEERDDDEDDEVLVPEEVVMLVVAEWEDDDDADDDEADDEAELVDDPEPVPVILELVVNVLVALMELTPEEVDVVGALAAGLEPVVAQAVVLLDELDDPEVSEVVERDVEVDTALVVPLLSDSVTCGACLYTTTWQAPFMLVPVEEKNWPIH
jgi:hypothetical protein